MTKPDIVTFPGVIIGPTSLDGCRLAPYVNMPSLRMTFDRLHAQHLPLTSPTGVLPTPPHPAMALPPMFLYPSPHYAMNLALAQSHFAHDKNSSIADLRLKAKKHAASLGLEV